MAGSSETEPWSRWPSATACQTAPMARPVDALIFEYTRRFVAGDADGVSELCETPFLAIRAGRRIHLSDPDAVREHFAQHITAPIGPPGTQASAPIALQVPELGDRAAFVFLRMACLGWRSPPRRPRLVYDVSRNCRRERLAVPLVHKSLLQAGPVGSANVEWGQPRCHGRQDDRTVNLIKVPWRSP